MLQKFNHDAPGSIYKIVLDDDLGYIDRYIERLFQIEPKQEKLLVYKEPQKIIALGLLLPLLLRIENQ